MAQWWHIRRAFVDVAGSPAADPLAPCVPQARIPGRRLEPRRTRALPHRTETVPKLFLPRAVLFCISFRAWFRLGLDRLRIRLGAESRARFPAPATWTAVSCGRQVSRTLPIRLDSHPSPVPSTQYHTAAVKRRTAPCRALPRPPLPTPPVVYHIVHSGAHDPTLPHPVLAPCHVMSCHVMSCHVMPCHIHSTTPHSSPPHPITSHSHPIPSQSHPIPIPTASH